MLFAVAAETPRSDGASEDSDSGGDADVGEDGSGDGCGNGGEDGGEDGVGDGSADGGSGGIGSGGDCGAILHAASLLVSSSSRVQ